MSPCPVFDRRLALLKDGIRRQKIDSFLITKGVNVSYMSGFTGDDAAIIVTQGKRFFITDSRYIEQAGSSVKGFDIRLAKGSFYEAIRDIVSGRKLKRVGFESTDLPYEVARRLKEFVPNRTFVPVKGLVEGLRSVKDAGEIALIKDSIRLTKRVFDRVKPYIRPGATEEALARRVEIAFIAGGAKPGFDPIVAADENSSKPHAAPTSRKISKDSFVMVDIGCALKKYNSDLTRIVAMGAMKPRMKKIYDIVRAAQARAIALIRPGARIADIDASARGYIQRKGFGRYFGHALGHGVGMEVHESPSISRVSGERLRPGMVFTVEPAIYIPKVGGIRVEDMVMVTDTGCEILSR